MTQVCGSEFERPGVTATSQGIESFCNLLRRLDVTVSGHQSVSGRETGYGAPRAVLARKVCVELGSKKVQRFEVLGCPMVADVFAPEPKCLLGCFL
jgi:hypothetical protein